LTRTSSREFNHEKAGKLNELAGVGDRTFTTPAGYRRFCHSVTVGRGKEAFAKASHALLSFKLFDKVDWVKMYVQSNHSIEAGSNVASVTRFYRTPLWSVNPCRVVSVAREQPSEIPAQLQDGRSKRVSRYSEVVFSTLQGHVIAGEEALRVYALAPAPGRLLAGAVRDKNTGSADSEEEEEVVFEVVSYSRGAGLLGKLGMPLLRPLQGKFGRDCCAAMSAHVSEGARS
jgi:uncharacterized protein (UPF0548 family)